jgi:L-histidine N-alpha-methyltransferase
MNKQFSTDVTEGLTNNPKSLPSKYFYDAIGDDLFVQIMNMPEYYLTNCEMEIFKDKTDDLISNLGVQLSQGFDLIELGAGDGTKTVHLLAKLVEQGYDFNYHPVDISQHALEGLENSLKAAVPGINLTQQQGDYFDILSKLNQTKRQKVILFLGSNIGNFVDDKAKAFLKTADSFMQAGDRLLIGTDLIKTKDIVLPAYSDSQGITAAFNLNLLDRINEEFEGDFDRSQFKHLATYEESEGIARSYIVSKVNQTVYFKSLNLTVDFQEGEKIHTEISRKYNEKILTDIISETELNISSKIMDSKGFFADFILKK